MNFNNLLSSALVLSTNEQVRLIRSLAGQRGLLVLSADQVARLKGPLVSERGRSAKKDEGKQGLHTVTRPNPLKGTAFEVEMNDAKAAVKQAKAQNGDQALPVDHPALVRYTNAVAAYRAEHKKLTVVGQPTPAPAPSKKRVRQLTPEIPGQIAEKSKTSSALSFLSPFSKKTEKKVGSSTSVVESKPDDMDTL